MNRGGRGPKRLQEKREVPCNSGSPVGKGGRVAKIEIKERDMILKA